GAGATLAAPVRCRIDYSHSARPGGRGRAVLLGSALRPNQVHPPSALGKLLLSMLESSSELETQSAEKEVAAARFQDILPLGPQWYLVAYRWLLVAAGIYTIWSTWNVWQVRTGSEFEFSPML